MRDHVAVIGAGVAGLTAAYLLRERYRVTVFERNGYAGGHANTVTVGSGGSAVAIDTGFIVYNETTYPGFTRFLQRLGVPTQPGDMSFACRCLRCDAAFSSHGLGGLFATRGSLLRRSQWQLLPDLERFYRHARDAMSRTPMPALTLGQYARRFGESRALIGHYLVPMAAAIWSTPPAAVLQMPFAHLARFLDHHGLIGWGARLRWRTVTGGSQQYVARIREALPCDSLRLGSPAERVERTDCGALVTAAGREERFDAVVLACHADQALVMLADPTQEERDALSAFRYTSNRVVLHMGDDLLPRQARARGSWNVTTRDCTGTTPELTMTYDMNRLQSLPGPAQYCVSVNPGPELDPGLVISEHAYTHPQYTGASVAGQARVAALQGERQTYYAGAHLGYGFHEDGFQSGARVARLLGVEA